MISTTAGNELKASKSERGWVSGAIIFHRAVGVEPFLSSPDEYTVGHARKMVRYGAPRRRRTRSIPQMKYHCAVIFSRPAYIQVSGEKSASQAPSPFFSAHSTRLLGYQSKRGDGCSAVLFYFPTFFLLLTSFVHRGKNTRVTCDIDFDDFARL